MNTEILKQLNSIAINKSIPFCYNCYHEAPTGICRQCGSDDLMRLLPGQGCEYGTEFIICFCLFAEVSHAGDRTVIIQVKGLSCPICAGGVESQLKKLPGIKNVTIHLSQGKAMVIADESVSNESLTKSIEEAGFSAGDITKVEVSK